MANVEFGEMSICELINELTYYSYLGHAFELKSDPSSKWFDINVIDAICGP